MEDKNNVMVKFAKLDGGRAPKQGLENDFGTDLYLREDILVIPSAIKATIAGTGIRTEFNPLEFGMLVSLRSSMSKLPISMANHIGVIEGTYRGEIGIPLRNTLTTQEVGDPTLVDYVLEWSEKDKKLKRVDTSKISLKLRKETLEALQEQLELFGEDPTDLAKRVVECGKLPKGSILLGKGTRVAQVYLADKHMIEWVEEEELTNSNRGDGGFGSTNK